MKNRFLQFVALSAALTVSVDALAQGTVSFQNVSVAPVFDLDIGYAPLSGTNFLVQMYGGPASISEGYLIPLGAPATFLPTGSGVFAAGSRTVPGVLPGANATIQLRAWTAASGGTYQAASHRAEVSRSPEDRIGRSPTLQVRTGGFPPGESPLPPGRLDGLRAFAIAPWPGWPEARPVNLVQNGDFDMASTAGWIGNSYLGIVGGIGAFRIRGDWIVLGFLEQDLPTTTGTYLLSFAQSGGEVRVFWGDVFLGLFYAGPWHNPHFVVTARTTPTRLRFEGAGAPNFDFVRVVAVPTNQPLVEMVAPTNDALYFVNEPILLRALPVAASGRTITRVDFLRNGFEVIGAATNSPWSFSWTNDFPNTNFFCARVLDDAGAITYSAIRVGVRGYPRVNWQTPSEGTVFPLGTNITLGAVVSDNAGEITRVDFYAESNLLATAPATGDGLVSAVWINAGLGNYRLSAVGRGATGIVDLARIEIHVVRPAVLDQRQSVMATSNSVYQNFRLAQTFTPGLSGRLQRIELSAAADESFDGAPLQVSIVDTQDGVPGTNVLGTATVLSAPWQATGGPFAVYFPPNQILLRAEQRYAIVLESETSPAGIRFHSGSDFTNYPRGALWSRAGGGPWQTNASLNGPISFSTYMVAAVPPVVTLISPADGLTLPENSSILIHAQVVDLDDDVKEIALYRDDILLAASPGPAITFLWSNVPPGNWVISARATDVLGNSDAATAAVLVGPTEGLPLLTIEGATALEGRGNQGLARFALRLSAPSTNEVTVDYATRDGTAQAPADYLTTNGHVTLPPGTTEATILVPTIDDVLDEPEEFFFLQLSHPLHAVLPRSQVIATVLDDEFGPGELHHFAWGAVPVSVLTRQPFAARLEARDIHDVTVSNFHGVARIDGIQQLAVNRVILNASNPAPVVAAGQWTAGYAFTPRTNLLVTALRAYFGTKLTLMRDDGALLVSMPAQATGSAWQDLPLPQPLQLEANRQYRLFAHTGGQAVQGRNDQHGTFVHGTIDAAYLNAGENYEPNPSNLRWPSVDLRYTAGTPIELNPMQAVGFVGGVWTGAVTVAQGSGNVLLQAFDDFGRVGLSSLLFVDGRAADVSLMQTAWAPLVAQGDPATWVVVVSNAGPATANNVVIRNSLPGDLPLLSAITSQGTSSNTPTFFRWNLGSLAVRTSATLQLTVGPTNFGTITCTSTVAAVAEPDPILSDRQARTPIVVNGRPRADAGADQLVECAGPATVVRLDGSGSADVDGDELSFLWREGDTVLGTNAIVAAFLAGGTHTLELEILDARGARAVDSVEVQVRDQTPPILTCLTNMTVEFAGLTGAVVNFQLPVTDACSIATVQCTPSAGSLFPIGTTDVQCLAHDTSSNLVSCRFPVVVLGARGTHRGVLDDLTSLAGSVTNRPDADRVRDALRHLTEALEPARWLDEIHVHPKRGEGVFKEDKDAVHSLLELGKGRSSVPEEVWLDLVRRLVRSDRLIAAAAIADAIRAGSDPHHTGKAQEELAKGDADALAGRFENAIDHYQHAWKKSSHLKAGRARGARIVLRFNGAPGVPYAIEASTNLVDWIEIEVRVTDAEGVIELEENDATRLPSRFFRFDPK